MRLGISGDLLPADMRNFTADLAREIREMGFGGVFTRFRANDPFETPSLQCHEVQDRVRGEGLEIYMCTGYWQPLLHSDEGVRSRAARTLGEALRVAGALGASCVDTGPGSMHPGEPANPHASAWYPHPANWGELAESQLVKSLKEAIPAAEEHGVAIHLEGHQLATLRNAEVMAAVIDAVDSPMVKCDLDPANWITLDTVFDTTPAVERMFEVLGNRIGSAHAKDVEIENRLAVHIENVPAGDGRLDFRTFIKGLELLGPDTYLIIEGCPVEDTARVRKFLHDTASAVAVSILG